MLLKRLSLLNFRNYQSAEIQFGNGVHILFGENGAGKTSVLEAIHYLGLTKSFRTTSDKHLILSQETMFRIEGEFQTLGGQSIRSAIAYSLQDGKQLTVNHQKAQKFSEYIGVVPIVLLHPSDLKLSQGSPRERRRFLDILLSQSSKLYLHHLIEYNRSLKQRNQLLQDLRVDPQLLLSWEENLITHGIEIINKRRETVAVLSDFAAQYYCKLSNSEDPVKIIYQNNVRASTKESLKDHYRQMFEQKRAMEREYRTTMVGPHRDELLFLLHGKPMKIFASQGEHKTFIIALKLAEFHYLQQQQQQSPILLFDDIFGELDANRIQQMLRQLNDIGQVFVTTTSRSFFDKIQDIQTPTHYYAVRNGTIEQALA